MSDTKSYEDLKVWQRAVALVTEVYSVTAQFPREEIYSLTSQIRKSAVSIPSNIAEGNARNSRMDYARFVSIAIGSAAELKTQLIIAVNLGFLKTNKFDTIIEELVQIDWMLKALAKSLRN